MIEITNPSACCGCSACVNACPVQCIVMRRDKEGFDYPIANPDLCISCGKCDAICPMATPSESNEPIAAYAARFEEYIGDSSSGGVFPALAREVIAKGGRVYGAVVEPDVKVGHAEACTDEEVDRMRGSKYVQSDLYSVFEDARLALSEGDYVLFTGTPCQVAGLKAYIRKPEEKLLTVDCACHGVPSPGLWERYVKALEAKYGKKITGVSFRDKSHGWRHYGMNMTFADGTSAFVKRENEPYLSLFMQKMTLRPSCYECKFKCGGSGSDITLSDLWCVHELVPSMNDDRGVSGVFLNTEKGLKAYETISPDHAVKVDVMQARRENGGLSMSSGMPDEREQFFTQLHLTTDVYKYMKGHIRRVPVHQSVYREARAMISRIKRKLAK